MATDIGPKIAALDNAKIRRLTGTLECLIEANKVIPEEFREDIRKANEEFRALLEQLIRCEEKRTQYQAQPPKLLPSREHAARGICQVAHGKSAAQGLQEVV